MTSDLAAASPLLPALPKGIEALTELAMDLRWSWNHAADDLWRELDPGLWKLTHHPNVVLQSVSRDRLASAMADPGFCRSLDALLQARRAAATTPAWFQRAHPEAAGTLVAYFCMEFMLSEALPIYSGGLGNVAGDQLKAASDLGVPVVGVGLLYQHGYFRQAIDRKGAQQALYPYNDPAQMPVTPVRLANGDWLRQEVLLPGGSVWLRAWQVQVGRLKLYLLDTNDAANLPVHRGITGELYGGDAELRLKQEIVLGVGGWRLLVALGLEPQVCHLNEGHAAFALVERARSFMVESGQPFSVALAATRVGNLFTTHTAVGAGFDRFSDGLIKQYLQRYAEDELGIPLRELLALGRRDAADESEPFNMAYLAMRGCGAANGVSRLHGQVSRRLFAPLFPNWPTDEVPIGHVTNGVHMPTWDSAAADTLWTDACSKGRWLQPVACAEANLRKVSDEALWALRTDSRKLLVEFAGDCVDRQMAALGKGADAIARAQTRLRPGVLTLGFARRFATYKRPNLLLHDPARLLAILMNAELPAQLILAGKAHPADVSGQMLIQDWTRFIAQNDEAPVVFLADYDMLLAERLVQGVDVWISTPRRPWEASGTSGMKVLVNGGLNLAELDGWWAEAYTPEVGWAIGDGKEHGDEPARDAEDAEALYTLLEQKVIPEFYARDDRNISVPWVTRMRESMAQLTPRFAASRTVSEYTDQYYLPAAAAFRARTANKGALAKEWVNRRTALAPAWAAVRFGGMTVETNRESHVIEVAVLLGETNPESVAVQLCAEAIGGTSAVLKEMERVPRANELGATHYRAAVSSTRPATDYTARLTARCGGLAVPFELDWVRWQK